MAGGWSRDGAENEQMEASIQEELDRMKLRRMPSGESFLECAKCGEEIPEKRRLALPGVKLCVECASERQGREVRASSYNRRGSKDSQLK
ncbi:DksA/TraR family C4-type zinc finger protein [Tropicibacter naphthalenivorans]|uniref:DksA-like zinc finger domain containing protein n=1 Tax=Tropicibacter naphthalenivorans TaxID=441103 RepID=A0A0P1G336_9RHOB|nr:DksA/TraR family C4-type zinc finger protein [Tropicibacter naphthalenivorans]CUH76205.1 DksA-like zinc finger domain containing protein [Tropicibacter naphthalenivorans]SMC39401.1 transcriptional regulator, TraR/DksA family [Tropicibacter naphthalenivorans]